MKEYFEYKGLVDITNDGSEFGVRIKDIDWNTIPKNGYLIAMVGDMAIVPKREEDDI